MFRDFEEHDKGITEFALGFIQKANTGLRQNRPPRLPPASANSPVAGASINSGVVLEYMIVTHSNSTLICLYSIYMGSARSTNCSDSRIRRLRSSMCRRRLSSPHVGLGTGRWQKHGRFRPRESGLAVLMWWGSFLFLLYVPCCILEDCKCMTPLHATSAEHVQKETACTLTVVPPQTVKEPA